MEKWQEYLQTITITLISAFLLSKLISLFLPNQPRNSHPTPHQPQHEPPGSDAESNTAQMGTSSDDDNNKNDDDDDYDDDWEGVESTELDEAFSAATSFVAATVAGGSSQRKVVGQEKQLELYGLYKIATEGPCTAPQPSAFKITARAKWQAWQRLGAMPPEEAMEKYIDIVTELYPSWASGSSMKSRRDNVSSSDSKGPMGPVFSSFVHEEESGNELKMDALHAFAREGEVDNLRKCIERGVTVNLKDSEGRTPLHWAVDRGHLNVVEELTGRSADVNAKDDEGQTPLHYAVICERENIARYLVKHNADVDAKDNDGSSPSELCESNWPWMHHWTTD